MSAEKKSKRGRIGHTGRSRRSEEHDMSSHEASSSQGFATINFTTSQPGASSRPSAHSSRLEQGNRVNIASASGGGPLERSPSTSTQGPPGKIAIPAIRREIESAAKRQERKIRTSHACENCRKAKAGCSGEQPCSRCRNGRQQCVYGDGKRDKERKRISKLSRDAEILSQHAAEVNDAIRRIRDDDQLSSEDMRAALDGVMRMTPQPLSPDDGDVSASGFERDDAHSNNEEFDTNAGAGSTGSLDVIEIDADKDDTRATGHMGKSSSVAWAKRTAMEFSANDSLLGRKEAGHTIASYHTEDADVENVDTSGANPYEWPDTRASECLIDIYFEHVHPVFPVLDKASFLEEYNTFPRNSADLSRGQKIWLGSLNTVWAISAVYARLAKRQDYHGPQHEHLFFVERAKMLSKETDVLYEDARIGTVLSLALLCLYYIGTNRLNRAWILCGLAIRHALTLGLHVRQIAKEISDVEKEHRVRLWWSLYTLECSLNELTGRPSCISDRDISTPLPVNIDENNFHKQHSLYSRPGYIDGGGEEGNFANHRSTSDTRSASSPESQPIASTSKRSYLSLTEIIPSEKKVGPHILADRSRPGENLSLAYVFPVLALPITSSTYFIYRTQLAIVSHEIVTQLYSAATIKTKWSDVQETIRRIDYRLLAWREDLPKEFDISFDTTPEPNWGDPYLPARTGLAMLFNSSRMILFRPCLCRFEGRLARQSSKSKDFNQDAVMTCIRSARKMIALMRWSADSAEKLYAINPWWTTLHYLCEALSVLMLELAFQAQHLPDEASHIFQDAKEGIRWLSMMSDQSVSARKAWEIYDSLIRLVATTINFSTDDMPNEAPVPLGYNWRRFSNAAAASHLAASDQQLTSANLQQYSGTQVAQHHAAATSVWATGTQDPMFHGIESFPSHPPSEMVPNPLDHTTALHHFSTFSLPHGHYDEPWHQYFVSDADMTFSATETSNGNMGDVSMIGMSEQHSCFGQLGFPVPSGFAGQGERGYGNIPSTTGGGTMYDPPSAYGPSAAYHDSRDQTSRRDSQMGEGRGGGVVGGDGAGGNRPGVEPLRFREY